ncbi:MULTISPECIES: hypothetical protein [unclassified Microbacterium]|uniref:hypothetical protein n=1 Tax=unclassified Microbacterium TaxID=2609290 RepID=UPI00387019D7
METTPRSDEMRILTVRQPWAWAIIHGGKDVENRVRNIAGDYRGPVAIHVAKAAARITVGEYDQVVRVGYEPLGEPEHSGRIIGVVDLVDVHSASVIGGCGRMDNNCEDHPHGCRHHCSPWAMGPAPEGWYQHLVLANPRPLAESIPYRGALGLRRLDADTIHQIEEQFHG